MPRPGAAGACWFSAGYIDIIWKWIAAERWRERPSPCGTEFARPRWPFRHWSGFAQQDVRAGACAVEISSISENRATAHACQSQCMRSLSSLTGAAQVDGDQGGELRKRNRL